MRSDSDKRRGWREGERERLRGGGGGGMGRRHRDCQTIAGQEAGGEDASVRYENYSYFLL